MLLYNVRDRKENPPLKKTAFSKWDNSKLVNADNTNWIK